MAFYSVKYKHHTLELFTCGIFLWLFGRDLKVCYTFEGVYIRPLLMCEHHRNYTGICITWIPVRIRTVSPPRSSIMEEQHPCMIHHKGQEFQSPAPLTFHPKSVLETLDRFP